MGKIAGGLRAALKFVRGECSHHWRAVRVTNFHVVRECGKCRTRIHIDRATFNAENMAALDRCPSCRSVHRAAIAAPLLAEGERRCTHPWHAAPYADHVGAR
jgi:hypothetical protein